MVKHKYTTPLAALALTLLAACSSNSPSSTAPVAALGGTASAAASPTSTLSAYDQALRYSQCMRSHGVPDFPDPTTNGQGGNTFTLKKGSGGTDPDSSQFKAAQAACQSLQPGGKGGAAGAFDPTKIGPWADCVRKHGIANFPDPENTGSGMHISLPSGVDQSALQSAIHACSSLSPGGMLQITRGSGGK